MECPLDFIFRHAKIQERAKSFTICCCRSDHKLFIYKLTTEALVNGIKSKFRLHVLAEVSLTDFNSCDAFIYGFLSALPLQCGFSAFMFVYVCLGVCLYVN